MPSETTGQGSTYLDNADEDPESIFFGRMSEKQSSDKIVHSLTICSKQRTINMEADDDREREESAQPIFGLRRE